MRLNHMQWLIFSHLLPAKWFNLIELEVFFWAGERETSQLIRTENWRQSKSLERPGARGKGWTRMRDGLQAPSPGVGTAAGVPMPWLQPQPGEKMLVGVGRTNPKENQLHWRVMKPFKVKACCCGWKMLITVFRRVRKHCPYSHAKEYFQSPVFPLLGQCWALIFFIDIFLSCSLWQFVSQIRKVCIFLHLSLRTSMSITLFESK